MGVLTEFIASILKCIGIISFVAVSIIFILLMKFFEVAMEMLECIKDGLASWMKN